MKKLLLSLMLLAATTFAFAQSATPGKFSVGLDAGIADDYPFGVGLSFKFDQPVSQKNFVTLSAGYSYFDFGPYNGFVKAFGGTAKGESYIPLKAGLKHYLGKKFYGEAQVGTAISLETGPSFAYSPGIGLALNEHFDLGLRYEAWLKSNTVSQVAVRFAYIF